MEALQILLGIIQLVTLVIFILQTRASIAAVEETRFLRIAELYRNINLQFDEISSLIPPEINDRPTLEGLRKIALEKGYSVGQTEKAIWRYYDLARTEFELCRMGVLTDEMWQGWLRGILSSFKFPAFQEICARRIVSNAPYFGNTPYEIFLRLAQEEPDFLLDNCGTVKGLMKWANAQSAPRLEHQPLNRVKKPHSSDN